MKRSLRRLVDGPVLAALLAGCGPVPDYRMLLDGDHLPPVLLAVESTGPRTIVITFNEAVRPVEGALSVTPRLAVETIASDGKRLVVTVGSDLAVGREYTLEAAAEDLSRNSITFLCHLYGYNPDLPEMVINEFITEGSDTHPDLVELFVQRGGNTAGMCILEGSRDHWSERLLFPEILVQPGDYLLVHWKPQGIPAEVDETRDKTLSGGYDASPNAFDLWLAGGGGLSGNNGAISLYGSPGGRLIDAVVYSNRTSASDSTYDGFGSKEVLLAATQIVEEGGWKISGEKVAPEDAVNPEDSTATRSICRDSRSSDSDSRGDWRVTPTKGSTFGGVNSDLSYAPQ